MHIENLVLETTRRCNLKCEHCLRGPAQRLDITSNIITNLFSQISSINYLIFTGGEPSLVPDIIDTVRNTALVYGVEIDIFYIVLNSKNTRNRIKLLNNLYVLKEICNFPEECAIQISDDNFHVAQRGKANLKYFDEFPINHQYWGNENNIIINDMYKGTKNSNYTITNIINEGYAKINNIGTIEIKQKPWQVDFSSDDVIDSVLDNPVYVAANGNIVSNCDLSYNRIDNESKGNILESSLFDIISKFCTTIND